MKKENVRGKAIFTIPYIGYLGCFVRTPVGLILLITIPASIMIITEIRNIIKELKKTKTASPIDYHSLNVLTEKDFKGLRHGVNGCLKLD